MSACRRRTSDRARRCGSRDLPPLPAKWYARWRAPGENGLLDHSRVGDLVHVDIKKLGRIPTGGGRRMHGVGTESARASKRTGPGTGKVGYTYPHSALDDHSRLAYTDALDDEKAVTAVTFWNRAVSFFAAHGITRIRRCLTDNGACCRLRPGLTGVRLPRDGHRGRDPPMAPSGVKRPVQRSLAPG